MKIPHLPLITGDNPERDRRGIRILTILGSIMLVSSGVVFFDGPWEMAGTVFLGGLTMMTTASDARKKLAEHHAKFSKAGKSSEQDEARRQRVI